MMAYRSLDFAQASHRRHSVSNSAFASSSVGVAVDAHVSRLAEDAVERPEPAHALRPAALLVMPSMAQSPLY
jgi:hypothetical protein